MYFPYLRGRQYELIAIRELVQKGRLSNLVVPIVEPVKLSSTLTNTISMCEKNGNALAFIVNPQVGSLYADARKDKTGGKLTELYDLVAGSKNIIKAIISGNDSKLKMEELIGRGISKNEVMSIYTDREGITDYDELFEKSAKYNVVPYDMAYRRIRERRILLSDRFDAIKKERNNDYAKKDDEFFSDDHLYYTDGYVGFSDYSIVGQEYQESGFAPYAVAIHIVYFDREDNLRIHHFVSDSNDDINDPAKKFYEAVSKLVEWNASMHLETEGIKMFEELHRTGAYPGLGVVKKLSIMHHLQLMGEYLEEKIK
jgi:hypothetical protein